MPNFSFLSLKLAVGFMLAIVVAIYMFGFGGLADNRDFDLYFLTIGTFFAVMILATIIKFRLFTGNNSIINLDPYLKKIPKPYKIAALVALLVVIYFFERNTVNKL